MKKILFSFVAFNLLMSLSFANCGCNETIKTPQCSCKQKIECDLGKACNIDKCFLEDDEYLSNNQCFFDKRFKRMKKALCLSEEQECNINQLYKNFRNDMENYHNRYRIEKNNIIKNIECDNCYKEDKYTLKEIKNDAKKRMKCFKKDIQAQLCKEQNKAFKKFIKCEKRKMKKIAKYSKVIKFPCANCSK